MSWFNQVTLFAIFHALSYSDGGDLKRNFWHPTQLLHPNIEKGKETDAAHFYDSIKSILKGSCLPGVSSQENFVAHRWLKIWVMKLQLQWNKSPTINVETNLQDSFFNEAY